MARCLGGRGNTRRSAEVSPPQTRAHVPLPVPRTSPQLAVEGTRRARPHRYITLLRSKVQLLPHDSTSRFTDISPSPCVSSNAQRGQRPARWTLRFMVPYPFHSDVAH